MFSDFSRFEIEDFAFDESFQKWVTGEDSDHQEFWDRYIADNPQQIDKILAARELVIALKKEAVSDKPDHGLAETIWRNVDKRTTHRPIYRWWWAAASALLLMGSGYFWWSSFHELKPGTISAQEELAESKEEVRDYRYMNTSGISEEVVLNDGTRITLEKASIISYSDYPGKKERVVHLNGNAFFDVAKDPRRPFIIYANKTVIKVLGTSFRVAAHEKAEKVVVSVRSGKVSVFERKQFEKNKDQPQLLGLVLLPNQQAEFSNELEQFTKMIAAEAIPLEEVKAGEFEFDQTPLPDVFQTLEKAYGIEIIYNRETLTERRLNVSLEDETLFEKLDVICQTMRLSYQVVDGKIIIENQ